VDAYFREGSEGEEIRVPRIILIIELEFTVRKRVELIREEQA